MMKFPYYSSNIIQMKCRNEYVFVCKIVKEKKVMERGKKMKVN